MITAIARLYGERRPVASNRIEDSNFQFAAETRPRPRNKRFSNTIKLLEVISMRNRTKTKSIFDQISLALRGLAANSNGTRRKTFRRQLAIESLEPRLLLTDFNVTLQTSVNNGFATSISPDGYYETTLGIEKIGGGVVAYRPSQAGNGATNLLPSERTHYLISQAGNALLRDRIPKSFTPGLEGTPFANEIPQHDLIYSLVPGSATPIRAIAGGSYVNETVLAPLPAGSSPAGGESKLYYTSQYFVGGVANATSSELNEIGSVTGTGDHRVGRETSDTNVYVEGFGGLTFHENQLYYFATQKRHNDSSYVTGLFVLGPQGKSGLVQAFETGDFDHRDNYFAVGTKPVSTSVGLLWWGGDETTGVEPHIGGNLLKDIFPGPASSGLGNTGTEFWDVGGTVYFTANDGVHGYELWKTNGFGAELVVDANPGMASGGANGRTNVSLNGQFVFTTDDGVHGAELWVTDNTTDGAHLIRDLNPGVGAGSAGSQDLYQMGGSIVFAGDNGSGDVELWQTDGTSAGTSLVADLRPDGSSGPARFQKVGNDVFFSAASRLYNLSLGNQTLPPIGYDFGDAPKSYGTFEASNRATGPMLGASRDLEAFGQPSEYADGDGADEDGVSFSAIVMGLTATVTISVNGIVGNTPTYLSGWIDFNGDGDFEDAGEQIISLLVTINGSYTASFAAPSNGLSPLYARFRVSKQVNLGATGAAPDGEVEDYVLYPEIGKDYGDAPQSYGTLTASNLARGPMLGATRDVEAAGQPSVSAEGDGADEDGVLQGDGTSNASFHTINLANDVAKFTVAMNIPVSPSGNPVYANLMVWIDWEHDGTFDERDRVFVNPSAFSANGSYSFSVPIPSIAILGLTYARFRLSQDFSGDPAVPLQDGETEDYAVTIVADLTAPVSAVSALPANATSLSIAVRASGSDPAGPGGLSSGIKEYDLYVAQDSDSWSKFATVAAVNGTATVNYNATSNHTYFFYSIARDNAGNVESKAAVQEATIRVNDLDKPQTGIWVMGYTGPAGTSGTGVNPQLYTVLSKGVDIGGSKLVQFDVYCSIDAGPYVLIGSDTAGLPPSAFNPKDSNESRDRGVGIPWMHDGQPHTYRFYSRGRDSANNMEDAPVDAAGAILPDLTLNGLFLFPVDSMTPVSIDVQGGAAQRSYITTVDVAFPNATDVAGFRTVGFRTVGFPSATDLSAYFNANGTLKSTVSIRKYATNAPSANFADAGTNVSGVTATVVPRINGGQILRLNFTGMSTAARRTDLPADLTGEQKIAAMRAGDGVYRIFFDTNGDGAFTGSSDRAFGFHRLLGDANGDRVVSKNDSDLITYFSGSYSDLNLLLDGDLNGDKKVDSADNQLTTSFYRALYDPTKPATNLFRRIQQGLFAYLND